VSICRPSDKSPLWGFGQRSGVSSSKCTRATVSNRVGWVHCCAEGSDKGFSRPWGMHQRCFSAQCVSSPPSAVPTAPIQDTHTGPHQQQQLISRQDAEHTLHRRCRRSGRCERPAGYQWARGVQKVRGRTSKGWSGGSAKGGGLPERCRWRGLHAIARRGAKCRAPAKG
jgi:hypothetical protein